MESIRMQRIRALGGALLASLLGLALARPLPLTAFAQTLSAKAAQPQSAPANPAPLEQGKFILHKFEQPIGEETYQITRDGDSLDAKIDFKFTDRSSPVPLTAAFRCAN